MNRKTVVNFWTFLIVVFFLPLLGIAQISSSLQSVIFTDYSSGEQDSIYIFCTNEGDEVGMLTAIASTGEQADFTWSKYNTQSSDFDFYMNDNETTSSTIDGLADGCYKVEITTISSVVEEYKAWVFNNYYTLEAEILDSDCESFTIGGTFDSPEHSYIDLSTGAVKTIFKNTQVEWKSGESVVARVLSPQIFDPPAEDTDYTLVVSDQLNCSESLSITYYSIVTEASFEVVLTDSEKDLQGEAPLEVTFENTSLNGTSGEYEWFIYRDIDEITAEYEATGFVEDSIMERFLNDEPVYTFENSGQYMVKLISKKISDFHVCVDTFYLEDYIVADTSYFKAPNVFTPNGDGVNDEFIIKFWSMKEVKISIFNRWGNLVHRWESGNVRGFDNTREEHTESVWDGRIGGKYASPGVYYFVTEGLGRDGVRRWEHGFVHLFRGKN